MSKAAGKAITFLAVFLLPLGGCAVLVRATDPVPDFETLLYVPVRAAEVATPSARAVDTTAVPGQELAVSVRSSDKLVEDEIVATPVGLAIPAIDLQGAVIPVGLSPDAVLDVPLPDTGGWYQHSVAPGQRGATVIAAHADLNGEAALFFQLRDLQVGQEIRIALSDGSEAQYSVIAVELHDKTALAETSLFRQQGEHALHLITCGGTFDREARSYRGNTVVIAVPTDA